MKTPFLVSLCLLLLSGSRALAADDQMAESQTAYAQAVREYIDAAGDNLKAIRAELDGLVKTATSADGKKRFELVYSKLDQTDELLADLRKAGPADFDSIKSKFEQTRADMLKMLDAARNG
jgi:hypothetical protein